MPKILISDLDGTIYRNKSVSFEDRLAIKKFERENTFIIATGRNLVTFEKFIKQFKLDFDFAILCNGALIIDNKFNVLNSNHLDDTSLILKILNETNKMKAVSISLKEGGYYYPGEFNEKVLCTDIDEKNIVGFCIEFEKEIDAESAYDKIKNNYNSFWFERNKNFIDVLPLGISKRTGIITLLKLINQSAEDVYVLGDSHNDISMFEFTNNSFVIDTDNSDIKKYANTVVKNISDCIQEVLKEREMYENK